MSGAVCELQLRAAGAFDVSVHTRYRPLCLQKPQTSGLRYGEGGVERLATGGRHLGTSICCVIRMTICQLFCL